MNERKEKKEGSARSLRIEVEEEGERTRRRTFEQPLLLDLHDGTSELLGGEDEFVVENEPRWRLSLEKGGRGMDVDRGVCEKGRRESESVRVRFLAR